MGTSGGAAGQGGVGGLGGMLPFILIFVVFYFLLIRPQQKRQKEHREMLGALKKGDRVITGGGIYGRITGVDENVLTVEIADKVRVKVNRANVSTLVKPAAQSQPKKDEKKKDEKKDSNDSK